MCYLNNDSFHQYIFFPAKSFQYICNYEVTEHWQRDQIEYMDEHPSHVQLFEAQTCTVPFNNLNQFGFSITVYPPKWLYIVKTLKN